MNIVWTASFLCYWPRFSRCLAPQAVGHAAGHDAKPTSALIEKVRAATEPFRDVRTHQACTSRSSDASAARSRARWGCTL